MNTAREEMLERVRAAVEPRAHSEPIPRDYRRHGTLDAAARVALLCERIADYQATVRRLDATEIARAVDDVCTERSAYRIGIPPGLPHQWRPARVEAVEDHGLTARELDALDGVVTGCTIAVAETGTLILTCGPAEGRRALTLVPDLHLCVVLDSQVVETVPEALSAVAEVVVGVRRPMTMISGPSATSDIELDRVEGVHGPRTLIVLVAADTAA